MRKCLNAGLLHRPLSTSVTSSSIFSRPHLSISSLYLCSPTHLTKRCLSTGPESDGQLLYTLQPKSLRHYRMGMVSMGVFALATPLFPVFSYFSAEADEDIILKMCLMFGCVGVFEAITLGAAWYLNRTVREMVLLPNRKVRLRTGCFGTTWHEHHLDGLIPPFAWSGHRRTQQMMWFVDITSEKPKKSRYFIDWKDSQAWKLKTSSMASRTMLEHIFMSNRVPQATSNTAKAKRVQRKRIHSKNSKSK